MAAWAAQKRKSLGAHGQLGSTGLLGIGTPALFEAVQKQALAPPAAMALQVLGVLVPTGLPVDPRLCLEND